MARVLTLIFAGLAAGLALLAWSSSTRMPDRPDTPVESAPPATGDIHQLLYRPDPLPTASVRPADIVGAQAVIIRNCPITVINKQDVPSQSEGVIRVIGTEVDATDSLSAGEAVVVRVGDSSRTLRRLKEDDVVRAGQLLACLDDRLSRDELEIKKNRLSACQSEFNSASRTAEELRARYETQLRLRESGRVTSDEEVRGAKLVSDRAAFEALAKRDAVSLAEREVNQADTALRMHEVRAGIPGIVTAIYKRPGEAVKRLEPVLQIQDHSRLRAEGLVDVQHVRRLEVGAAVSIEPFRAEAPRESYLGHGGEVTGVATCALYPSVFVSTTADGSVQIWDRTHHGVIKTLRHPAGVLCVACVPPGTRSGLFLYGGADGTARIGDLAQLATGPRELKGKHDGAINAVAFSPDGKTCATGGEDREVHIWNTDGTLRYRLPAEHRGGVTFVAFTRRAQMVTASRDNAVRVWTLGEASARLDATFEHRSGDVPRLDVRADGSRLLYDNAGGLQILSLPSGVTESVLRPDSGRVRAFTRFSPSGRLVLSAEGAEGPLRLWLVPASGRGREVCQLIAPGVLPTCADFSADGAWVIVGTRDRQVMVWPVPPEAELERVISGQLTRIDHAVGPGGKQVRVWADFLNLDGAVVPGTTTTIVVQPERR